MCVWGGGGGGEKEHRCFSAAKPSCYSTNCLPKNESSNDHDPEPIDNSTQSKDKLTNTDENTKNNSANPNSKHSVKKKASKYGKNNIRPRVDRIEDSILGVVHSHNLWREGREGGRERREKGTAREGEHHMTITIVERGGEDRNRRRGRERECHMRVYINLLTVSYHNTMYHVTL